MPVGRSMSVRFTSPIMPGETLSTEIWRDGDVVNLRVRVPDRNVVVMDNGRAELRAA